LGGIINSINDAFYGNETLKKIDELSYLFRSNSTENLDLVKQENGFFLSKELSYSIEDGLLILTNNSLIDFSFQELVLMINNESIPLNTCNRLAAGEKLVILKRKPNERKHGNYIIHKKYSVDGNSTISLKFNDEILVLKETK
jgi:hypothetical protein